MSPIWSSSGSSSRSTSGGLPPPRDGPGRAGRDLERRCRPGRVLVQGQPVALGRSPSSPANLAHLWCDTGCTRDQRSAGLSYRSASIPASGVMRIDQTRALLLAVTDSGLLSCQGYAKASDRSRQARRTGQTTTPRRPCSRLAEIWNELDETRQRLLGDRPSPGTDQHPRPKIFPPR